MISIEQWRCAIGQYCPRARCTSFRYCSGDISSAMFVRACVCVVGILVYLSMLLLLSGDVETNPGPTQQVCPQCSASVDIRKTVCNCAYNLRQTDI